MACDVLPCAVVEEVVHVLVLADVQDLLKLGEAQLHLVAAEAVEVRVLECAYTEGGTGWRKEVGDTTE